MRTFFYFLLLLVILAAVYGYVHNPQACAKLGQDLVAVYTTIPEQSPEPPLSAPPSAPASAPTNNTSPAVAPSPASLAPPADTNTVAGAPTPPPIKKWAPPDILPAKPNWTWTTTDGTAYQNVVILKIDSDTVKIMHSAGVTSLDISSLSPDIQKQLNYDPDAAAAAKVEARREEDHPFYPYAQAADAEAVARQMHWPVAWLFSWSSSLSALGAAPDSEDGTTQAALNVLKTQTIVIFSNGPDDLGNIPQTIRSELYHLDDGTIPGGHHYYTPKIVISNADATQTFGRVWYTEMKNSGMAPLDSLLSTIQNDPKIQAVLSGQPATPSATPSAAAP